MSFPDYFTVDRLALILVLILFAGFSLFMRLSKNTGHKRAVLIPSLVVIGCLLMVFFATKDTWRHFPPEIPLLLVLLAALEFRSWTLAIQKEEKDKAIVIRRIRPSEWRDYKALRLRALQESPDAYGSTYQEESLRADGQWEARLEKAAGSGKDFPMFAVRDGKPVGLCWAQIEPAETGKVTLYQVWVAPEARGAGVAACLLDAAKSWAQDQGGTMLFLGVTCGDTPAVRLYRRAGFVPVGQPVPLREGSALLSQDMQLVL